MNYVRQTGVAEQIVNGLESGIPVSRSFYSAASSVTAPMYIPARAPGICGVAVVVILLKNR